MSKKYKMYSDAGHGWLAVKRSELIELGLIGKISHYSYQRGQTVYLEEDCDASLFFNFYTNRYNKQVEVEFKHTNNTSPIRSYESFSTR